MIIVVTIELKGPPKLTAGPSVKEDIADMFSEALDENGWDYDNLEVLVR